VLQQIRSFTILHAAELESLAAELETAGQPDLAAKIHIYRDLHAQEAGLILDELTDVQADLDRQETEAAEATPEPFEQPAPSGDTEMRPDPAASSPKRARWLAEQAEQSRQAQRPRSRRDLFQRPKS